MEHTKKIPGKTWTADELLMMPYGKGVANETRMELLFDAADGMTNEQAIAYLEHGAEIIPMLVKCGHWINNPAMVAEIEMLLAKLEVK